MPSVNYTTLLVARHDSDTYAGSMTWWRSKSRMSRAGTLLAAFFVICVLAGAASGDFIKSWNEPTEAGFVFRLIGAIAYSFAGGLFRWVVPIIVVFGIPVGIIVGIVVLIRRRSRRRRVAS